MDNKVTSKNIYIYNQLVKNGFIVNEDSLLKKTITFRKLSHIFRYTPSLRQCFYSENKSFDVPDVETLVLKCNNITLGQQPPTFKQEQYLRKLCEITGTSYEQEWSLDAKKCSQAITTLIDKKDQMKLEQYYPKSNWEIHGYPEQTKSADVEKERYVVEGNWGKLRAELTGFGYVYVIDGGDKCKIGKSKHPKSRIKTLISQAGLPRDTNYKIYGPLTDHSSCESYCHKMLSERRIPGSEWFSVDFQSCVSEVDGFISDKGFTLSEAKIAEIQDDVEKDYIKKPILCFKHGKVKWFWDDSSGVFKGYEKSKYTKGPVKIDQFYPDP